MSHHIYQTEAFVLEARNIGEANKYFALFTRELGMIEATAQGIRNVKSKLRHALGDFSRVNVALVRGKNSWKITNAIVGTSLYEKTRHDRQVLLVIAHTCALLKRLLNGEEKNEALFDTVANAFTFLTGHLTEHSPALTKEEIANAECVLVLNILHLLGYVGEKDEFKRLISEPAWNKELLAMVDPLRKQALLEINRSLKESQL